MLLILKACKQRMTRFRDRINQLQTIAVFNSSRWGREKDCGGVEDWGGDVASIRIIGAARYRDCAGAEVSNLFPEARRRKFLSQQFVERRVLEHLPHFIARLLSADGR